MRVNRRNFAFGLGYLSIQSYLPNASAQPGSFDSELAEIISDEELMARTRELGYLPDDLPTARGTVRSRERSDRKISERAIKLIIAFEVTSKDVYIRKYQGVTRPGGQSGITMGVGYDLGYVTQEYLREDWSGYLSNDELKQLSIACNVRGTDANSLLLQLSNIRIPWDKADDQFRKKVLPIYIAATLGSLDNADLLSDDALGALVSLVYNRGASFTATGDRYSEMRQIKKLMRNKQFDLIPDQLEKMAGLWTSRDVIGVAKRRHLEALLFREGFG